MSRILVDLEKQPESADLSPKKLFVPEASDYQKPKKRGKFAKILTILGATLIAILLIGAIGGYFYWQSLKATPQYSLALLVDAARRDDQKTIDELVDTNAVVDDFMPQITDKAVELYGRGLPPQTVAKVAQVAAPLLPAVKQRARSEVPGLIREKTQKFESVPFWAIALGAGGMLDIQQNGDKAVIKSSLQERPLEVTMKRNGTKWQIVGVKDEVLARRIAEKVGQEIIAAARKGGIEKAGKQLGIENLQDILKETEIFR
jgi:hypothetical protein